MKALFALPGPNGGTFEFRDVPAVDPGPGQARILVRASGLNRGALISMSSLHSDPSVVEPMPVGVEFAGEVDALGDGVGAVSVGDRVMGRGRGATAEYVTLDARFLMPVPDGWSWEEAASVPNVFITSHDAIVTNGRFRSGESLMVTAGSSGVGTASLQIARLRGAKLTLATTRSPAAKGEALQALGADAVIDTTLHEWPQAVLEATGGQGVDVIVDTVGAPLLSGILDSMALRGRLVSVGRTGGNVADIDLDLLARKRLELIGVTFRSRTEEEDVDCTRRFAEDLLPALIDGQLMPVLHEAFPWQEVAAAYRSMSRNVHIGKIVVVM
jgi:NADPH:quinone reductase-like Zn-dependent oxidoreductase